MSTLITLTALYILVLVAAREIGAGGWSRQLGLNYGMPAGDEAPWLKSVNWNGGDDKKSGEK
jgi:hypothetical protein